MSEPPPLRVAPFGTGPALVFVVGPYQLMVAAQRVRELLSRGEPVSGGGHLAWRARLVPVVGLAALLGGTGDQAAAPTTGHLIYGEGGGEGAVAVETLVSFEVDRVVGLRPLAPGALRPLPPLPPGVARLFSGLVLDPAGGPGLLWLSAGPAVLLRMWRDRRAADGIGRRS